MGLKGIGYNGFGQLDRGFAEDVEGVIWAGLGAVLYKTEEGAVLKNHDGERTIAKGIKAGFGIISLEGALDDLGQIWKVRDGDIADGPFGEGIKDVKMCGNGRICLVLENEIKLADSVDELWDGEVLKALEAHNVRIVKLECGECHFLALDDQSEVYSWGSNLHGQLGREIEDSEDWTPRKIEVTDYYPAIDISCGGWMAGVVSNGGHELAIWGWTRLPNIIDGIPPDEEDVTREWHDYKITSIAMGNSYIAYTTSHGLLIRGEFSPNDAPQNIKKILYSTPWNIFGL
ncbi:hypothetical protein TRICI_000505 [Trichomonascus ciferrii]|uniref:Uncharacterized protein n=1 Tax=Trichomonascus ciferrii TaxID=44093 RepID=A0A642VD85_9ASCO|nr:hypothetical protein TRICI_000505 [Trichomonascus ciferrii]